MWLWEIILLWYYWNFNNYWVKLQSVPRPASVEIWQNIRTQIVPLNNTHAVPDVPLESQPTDSIQNVNILQWEQADLDLVLVIN